MEGRGRSANDLIWAAIEGAPAGIALVDRDLRYLYVNEALARANGRPREQHLGLTIRDTLPPYAAERVEPLLRACFATGAGAHDVDVTTADEVPAGGVWWRLSLYPITVDGEVVAVAGLVLDVSAERRAELEQERLKAALRQAQKMEAVGQLAAGVAHDFNNLLMAISGYSELGLVAAAEPKARHALQEIKQAAAQAAGIVGHLLSFAHRQDLDRRPVDLRTLVEDTAPLVLRLLGPRIRLQLSLADELPTVEVDPTQVQRVLLNLATNARDAMPDGGLLTIETHAAALDGQPGVALAVCDTGTGMDAETVARIFDPFFTTKPVGKGTGLGLAVVHGVVEQSGGTIAVRSEPGAGSRFEIRFPALPGVRAEEPERPPEAEPVADGTILLVEDDAAVRRLTREYLQSVGYRVLAAANADEAERLFAAERPDVLVTDLVMPGVGGRTLARMLRARDPGLPVLFVSGYAADAVGGPDEADAFVQKPYELATLAETVRTLRERPRAA